MNIELSDVLLVLFVIADTLLLLIFLKLNGTI